MLKFEYGLKSDLYFSYEQLVNLFKMYKYLMEDKGYELYFSDLDKKDFDNDDPMYKYFPKMGEFYSIEVVSTEKQFTKGGFDFEFHFVETERYSNIYKLRQKGSIFNRIKNECYDIETCIKNSLLSLKLLNEISDYYDQDIKWPFEIAMYHAFK